MRHGISPARNLLAVLERKSNFANGCVWYGRAITYAKIASWFEPDRPSERTLQRWMAELLRGGIILVRRERFNQGMRIALRVHAVQGNLFEEGVEKPVEKAVEKPRNSQTGVPPNLAGGCRQTWREKEVYLKEHYKDRAAARATAPCRFAEDRKIWTPAERLRKLGEFYALKHRIANLPAGHPRLGELILKHGLLENELGRQARAPAIENSA
ncbi:MAG: hypothetical protein ACLP1Y_09365 [Candidatus Acidiferrales bacterium]